MPRRRLVKRARKSKQTRLSSLYLDQLENLLDIPDRVTHIFGRANNAKRHIHGSQLTSITNTEAQRWSGKYEYRKQSNAIVTLVDTPHERSPPNSASRTHVNIVNSQRHTREHYGAIPRTAASRTLYVQVKTIRGGESKQNNGRSPGAHRRPV